MNSSNPISSNPIYAIPKYRPPQLRDTNPPSRPTPRSFTYREQPFLTYEDLHLRYSPHSPPRMPRVYRSLSINNLYQRFHRNPPTIPRPPSTPSSQPHSPRPPSSLNQHARLSTRLPDPPIFTATNANVPFNDWKLRI